MKTTNPPSQLSEKGHTRLLKTQKRMIIKIPNLKLKIKTYLCALWMDLDKIWNHVRWCKNNKKSWSWLGWPLMAAEQVVCGSRVLRSSWLKANIWMLLWPVWYRRFWNRTSVPRLRLPKDPDWRMSRRTLTSKTSSLGKNDNNPEGSGETQQKYKEKSWRRKKD